MTTLIDTTVNTVRRTRRAYIGALGLSYDFAKRRAELRRSQLESLFGDLVTRGEVIEGGAKTFFDKAKLQAAKTIEEIADTVEDAAEDYIETVEAKVKPSAKTRTKTVKTTATKTAAETAPTTEAAETSKPAETEVADKYAAYVEKVQAYDSDADPKIVKAIVDHLGIALQNRDSMFVACSDPAERETVAKSWLVKKLGLTEDATALDAKVATVCEMMKADRLKDRVTFYYLAAKNEGKLETL